MNETGLFIAGTIVSGIVFTGAFLYAMLSLDRYTDRNEAESLPLRTTSEEPNA